MTNIVDLPWGSSVAKIKEHVERVRGLGERPEGDYLRMGCLRNDEYAGLLILSRSAPIKFAICGSLSETLFGLYNRNYQHKMTAYQLEMRFPPYRRTGIPHFKDVDIWVDSSNSRFDLSIFKKQISGIFHFISSPESQIDFAYSQYHKTEEDLSPFTRSGDRREAPGGIVFHNGQSRRILAFWQLPVFGLPNNIK